MLPELWKWIDGKITWVGLSRLRNSFLSRAILALSLSALVLAHLSDVLERQGVDTLSLRFLFFGGVVFLVGYLLFGLWAPSEFGQPGELYDHVQRMGTVADADFDRSRLDMAQLLCKRFTTKRRFGVPAGLLEGLRRSIQPAEDHFVKEDAKTDCHGNKRPPAALNADVRAGLFHADMALRQHDFPIKRMLIWFVIVAGAVLLILPTTINALRVFLRPVLKLFSP